MNFNYKFLLSLLLIASLCHGSGSVQISDLLEGFKSKGIAELFGDNKELAKSFSEFLNKNLAPKATCNSPAVMNKFLCPLITGGILLPFILPGDIPIVSEEINIADIGDFVSTYLSQPQLGALLSGPMTLKTVNLYYLNQTTVDSCGFLDGSSPAELKIKMDYAHINVVLEIEYKMNITVASIIPIYGEGVISLSIGLDFGVDTTVKYCPIDEPMGLLAFDFSLALAAPVLGITGLLQGDFVDQIVKLINLQVLSAVPDIVHTVEQLLHPVIKNYVLTEGNKVLEDITPCAEENPLFEAILGNCTAIIP